MPEVERAVEVLFELAPRLEERRGRSLDELRGDRGHELLKATFDGHDVQVVLDTGSAHTLLVDATPRPNETEVVTEDALGRPLVVYQSTVTLGLAERTKVAPLLRAPAFDIITRTSQQMGRKLDGLIGLSAFGAIFMDDAKGVLRVAF